MFNTVKLGGKKMIKDEEWARILINTHRKDCIDLLKARDYFFDIARKINRTKMICMFLPVTMLVFSYFPFSTNIYWVYFQNNRDYIVGFFSIIMFIINFKQQNLIEEYLEKSNILREEYDVRVFDINPNVVLNNNSDIENLIKFASKMKDLPKYEVWYSEIFGNNKWNNIICCQMDNILYTHVAYTATKRIMTKYTVILVLSTIIGCGFLWSKNMTGDGVLLIISVFSILQFLLDSIESIRDQLSEIQQVMKNIKIYGEELKECKETDEMKAKSVVRCLQDYIISYRSKSIFITKYVRNKYLSDEGNEYYKLLDEVKNLFIPSDEAHIISSADEIPILEPCNNKKVTENIEPQEEHLVNMEDIHVHLLNMLQDVKTAWEEKNNQISYTLDGGSLIGAYRENGKILFWDDDVDLIVPYNQIDRAKEQIRKFSNNKYVIQDFENEEFYSSRLSNFRIREENSISEVTEKDSPLYTEYNNKGLFIDVYAYTPIVCCRAIDILYRCLFLYPLNYYLKKLEDRLSLKINSIKGNNLQNSTCYKTDQDVIYLKKQFSKYKNKYLRRVRFYCKIGKNKKYVTYTPNYIASYKSFGPYILSKDIQIDENNLDGLLFENMTFPISNNPEGVLCAIYGKGWNKSPVKTKEQLCIKSEEKSKKTSKVFELIMYRVFKKRAGAIEKVKDVQMFYSDNSFRVSSLKHLGYVNLKENYK